MGKNKKININDYLGADETTFMTLSGSQFAMIKDAIRETVNEEWKSKIKEIVDLYNNTLQCTRQYNKDLADILCDLEELLD